MSVIKIKASDGSWVDIPAFKGPKGKDGITPNITFQVEELATGSSATLTKSGTAENPIIKLGLPKGSNGTNADISKLINKSGFIGTLSGYQTPTLSSSNITINQDSNSGIELTTASTVTVNPGTEGTSWIKTVLIKNASTAVSLGDSWVWSGGEPPTIEENSRLTLCWNNDLGVATLVKGGAKVIKGTITNNQNSYNRLAYVWKDASSMSDTDALYSIPMTSSQEVELKEGYYIGGFGQDSAECVSSSNITLTSVVKPYGGTWFRVDSVSPGFECTIMIYAAGGND